MLSVRAIGPCYRSVLSVRAISPCYQSVLSVHAISPSCRARLYPRERACEGEESAALCISMREEEKEEEEEEGEEETKNGPNKHSRIEKTIKQTKNIQK